MVVLARPGPSVWRRRASLLIAGAFVAFLAMQAPHLVHHFFEPEHVKDECPFAANGERTGGIPRAAERRARRLPRPRPTRPHLLTAR
jgi:hypothetical protein